jgi:predicted outer membrane repeat protein
MKICGRLIATLLIVAVILILPAVSTSLNGGPSANIGNSADSVGGYSTPMGSTVYATGQIQTAVNNAPAGSTVYLWPKKYYDNVDVNKNLKIIGSGALLTSVDGQKLGSVFTIDSGVTATLAYMTIQNGKATNGGGIANMGSTTVKNCDIIGNTADNNGAGIYNSGNTATLTVKDCNILGNTANQWGGGIGNYNGGKINVEDSLIANNKAGTFAGGIDDYISTTATVNGCVFKDNAVGNGNGGAIEVESGSTLTAYGDVFIDNSATYGGGISNHDNSKTTVAGSVFWSNKASVGGGAIYSAKDSTLVQTGNVFMTPTDTILDPSTTTNLR